MHHLYGQIQVVKAGLTGLFGHLKKPDMPAVGLAGSGFALALMATFTALRVLALAFVLLRLRLRLFARRRRLRSFAAIEVK